MATNLDGFQKELNTFVSGWSSQGLGLHLLIANILRYLGWSWCGANSWTKIDLGLIQQGCSYKVYNAGCLGLAFTVFCEGSPL